MTRSDVAIYAPGSAGLYDRAHGRTGGAERQMILLARALADRGLRVAQIVYPVQDPIPLASSRLQLVERGSHAGDRRLVGRLLESVQIWRALRKAGGRVVVVRAGTPVVGLAGLFCWGHRRALIFSSASDSDFTFEKLSDRRHRKLLYELGVRLADAVVVQSENQVDLASRAFPKLRRVVHIPSFVEGIPPTGSHSGGPECFIWIGRLIEQKQPVKFIELARALPEARFKLIPRYVSPSVRADLEAAAHATPNVELLEPMTHAQTIDLIARSVAVVNTSQFEGMPNVFLEAWAHGVPALSLNVDPDGVVSERRLGIAAQGSWEAFVAGARELWEQRGQRDELSARTRAYVSDVHSLDAVGARWGELIGDLAGS